MEQFKKFLVILSLFLVIFIPALSLAQPTGQQPTTSGGLVPCTNTAPQPPPGSTAPVEPTDPCGWNQLLQLIANVIHFILFKMVVPIAAIMFAYAGFLLLTAGGEAGQKGRAKKIFSNVVLGLVIAIAAWLIVSLILRILGYNGAWIGF